MKQVGCNLRQMDSSCFGIRLHTTGSVDRVPNQCKVRCNVANHCRHNWPTMEANPDSDCAHGRILLVNQCVVSGFDRTQRKLGNPLDVVIFLLLNTIGNLGIER